MTPADGVEPAPHQLTVRQQRILAAIREWVAQRGYSPTVREIGAAVGLSSPSSVAYQLTTLQRLGYLRREEGWPRTVDVRAPADTNAPEDPDLTAGVSVPVVGAIAAGAPILADEHIEEHLVLPVELVGHGVLFALRVKGNSMAETIHDGDFVIVRQQPAADNGDIVAAMLDGEATVKEYKARNGRVDLVPHNPLYEVMAGNQAVILGKVVSVLRRM
jgi:repressor LexA